MVKVTNISPQAIKQSDRLKSLLMLMYSDGITIAELARRCNLTRQAVNARFTSDDCKLSDLEKMVEALGYECTLTIMKKEED